MTKKLKLVLLILLVGSSPLTTFAQYSWENDEGGTYNIPSEEYNPVNHAFGSSDNVIYNKIGFNPSAANPRTMRIKDVSGSTINMYDFLGNLMPDKALDNRAIGWDWVNDERNGGIIAASIAEIKVGNTNHTMVYAWSVLTDGRRRSGWIKLSDLEDSNDIKDMLEDNKGIRMDILRDGGIDDAIYDEYTIVEATLPAFAEEYYIRAGRDQTKSQGKAKYYYTRDGYISGIKNIMENSRQRYGVAHNNIPVGAKFYKDRNFNQVDVEIYAGVEDEDDYDDDHVFTPISEKLQIVWGYTVTGAGEKIYSFINNRTLVATGNNDVTGEEKEEENGDSNVVHITKRNAAGFAIDGRTGAADNQNVHLWTANKDAVNQQWIEIDRGNGYYSYQKIDTNHCIDGGTGGANKQNVVINTCNATDQNQHWKKEATTGGAFKLIKRNSQGFAIDGGTGGAKGQNIGLYNSSNSSYNLQWFITPVGSTTSTSTAINIAPNGTASQSSTGFGGIASRAIDKNTSGLWADASVTHTGNEDGAHWKVNWDDNQTIDEIKIYNRTGCCTDRLSNFRVIVKNSGTTVFTQAFTDAPNSTLTVDTGGVVGDQVRVQLNGKNYLSLAEVEVFGNIANDTVSSFKSITAEANTSEGMVLYPNPTEDNEINIILKNDTQKTVSVLNLSGQTVLQQVTNDQNLNLKLSNLPRGLYFLIINYQDGSSEQQSFVKN